jgi:hypothetical protein
LGSAHDGAGRVWAQSNVLTDTYGTETFGAVNAADDVPEIKAVVPKTEMARAADTHSPVVGSVSVNTTLEAAQTQAGVPDALVPENTVQTFADVAPLTGTTA